MQEMGIVTMQEPVKKILTMKEFSGRLNNIPQVCEEMKAWNLAVGKDLMTLKGGILKPDVILGNGGKISSCHQFPLPH